MSTVFISYKHCAQDSVLAHDIAQFLEGQGLETFTDKRLEIGQEWITEIDKQIRRARYFVVLLSAESILSDMVRWEVQLAHKLLKAGQIKVLPVRVDYQGDLPMDLGAYLNPIQQLEWQLEGSVRELCEKVLKGIRQGMAQGGSSDLAGERSTQEDLGTLMGMTEGRGAPLPSADPRTGAVKLDSPYYVRRAADHDLERLVVHKGVTVLVKGPRQVGKTSLLARGIAFARKAQVPTFYIDLQLTDISRFASLDILLKYISVMIARELSLKEKPNDYWDEALGATDCLTGYVEKAVLQEARTPIIFAFDEVDSIFKYDFRTGFFAMMRAWHNRRATKPEWNWLNLLIGHSNEPALFIEDINQSPFNVGEVIRLSDFTMAETRKLNEVCGRPLRDDSEIEALLSLLGGHPYLVRQAIYSLQTTVADLRQLQRVAVEENGPFGDHLRRQLWNIHAKEPMKSALKQILKNNSCDSETDFQKLKAVGLISGESRDHTWLRSELYRQYFHKHL